MELLIKTVEPTPFRAGAYRKGDVVEVRANGAFYGAREGLPDFVIVKCPNLLMKTARDYVKPWDKQIQFVVVSSDSALDGYRVRLFTANASASGLGHVTRAQVETFINSWGGSVVSVAANKVVFDITILDAIKSSGYWDIDLAGVIFTEVSYDPATGVHVIDADYNAIDNNPSYIETFLEGKVKSIVSHANKVIRFEIDRDMVRTEFEGDIARGAKQSIERRRWYVPPATVDTVVGLGGVVTVTPTQLTAYLKDRTLE